VTGHVLAQYLRHGCFSPIGDHFYDVDKVLALSA